jgi:hypothetical protein
MSVCGSDWADVLMNIIGNQSNSLTIFPILLDSKSLLDLCWEFWWFALWSMVVNHSAFAVVEYLVI